MNTMKKRGCQILVLFMTAGMLTGCGDGTPKLEDALKKTASYEMKTVEDPASDALGGLTGTQWCDLCIDGFKRR